MREKENMKTEVLITDPAARKPAENLDYNKSRRREMHWLSVIAPDSNFLMISFFKL